MAPCTMNRPTAKLSRPKAVRFRWKLSVSRAMSLPCWGGRSSSVGRERDQIGQARGLGRQHDQARQLVVSVQQALRDADIGEQQAGGDALGAR